MNRYNEKKENKLIFKGNLIKQEDQKWTLHAFNLRGIAT